MRKTYLSVAIIMVANAFSTSAASSLPVDTAAVGKTIVLLWYAKQPLPEVGTGFLLQIPLKTNPGRAATFIITARHVVDPQWAGCAWSNPSVLNARVNTTNYNASDGQIGMWETALTLERNRTWFAPEDDKVDIAVLVFSNQQQLDELMKQDIAVLHFSEIATDDEIQRFTIGTGDGILSAGLVPALLDAKRIYPAFKFGRISNLLHEPMKTKCSPDTPLKERWAWILSANFVPGNSGSPVFLLPTDFTVAPPLQYNGPRPMLLGVLSSTIEGADLAEMAPIESIVPLLQQLCTDCNFYRGKQPEPTKK